MNLSAKFKEIDDLRIKMETIGYRWQKMGGDSHEPGIFYKRVTTKRPCTTNDKDQLVVRVFDQWSLPEHLHSNFPNRFSLSMEITGEFKVGENEDWANLSVYGLTEEQFFERHTYLEQALVRAWEALV